MPEGLEADFPAIDVAAYKDRLIETLAAHGLGPESLELVDGFSKDPYRATKNLKIQKIVQFVRTISPETRFTTWEVVLSKFPDDEKAALADDWLFLKHRLLSGVHSFFNRWKTDHECDKWAFYEIKREIS